jgi:hypothetical protein
MKGFTKECARLYVWLQVFSFILFIGAAMAGVGGVQIARDDEDEIGIILAIFGGLITVIGIVQTFRHAYKLYDKCPEVFISMMLLG